MPNGRNLCDRHDRSTATPVEDAKLPLCGSCVIVAETLYRHALRLFERHEAPAIDPFAATELLRTTGWTRSFNLDELLENLAKASYSYPTVETGEAL